MTTAGKILTVNDRTPKERRDMADFYCVSKPAWLGKDMYAWTFDDGSRLMMTYDENLHPIEMIEV